MQKVNKILKPFLKDKLPQVRPGDKVKVYQQVPASGKGKKGKDKERIQVFEGTVIAKKHGREIGSTITVRKVISGIGVEKIIPLHLPTIKEIEVLKRSKVRRAKLYYLRKAKGRRAKLKRKEFTEKLGSSDKTTVKLEKAAEKREIKKEEDKKDKEQKENT
jgi:large subunit ribosomal protein L19